MRGVCGSECAVLMVQYIDALAAKRASPCREAALHGASMCFIMMQITCSAYKAILDQK